MDWTKFNNHGESPNHAFEVMCNILFKCWLKKEYKDNISHFAFVNGSGGDGGVEAYGLLKSGDIIGVQSKWFPQKMETSVYKGYKQDKIEMRGDRAEMSDFPLYLNTVAGGLDCRDQTIGGFSFVVKIYAVPVIEIIG